MIFLAFFIFLIRNFNELTKRPATGLHDVVKNYCETTLPMLRYIDSRHTEKRRNRYDTNVLFEHLHQIARFTSQFSKPSP